MSDKIINKNTVNFYNCYSTRMVDPTKKYGVCLCISLDNNLYIKRLKVNNKVIVVSDKYNILNDYTFKNEKDLKEFLEKLGMKFDCIIMNPPYDHNLHLKIFKEAITHLKDNNSKCVNLSPVRWLQDPLIHDKKTTCFTRFEKSISKHLNNVDVIKAKVANELFGIRNFADLAIYEASKNNGSFDYEHQLINDYLGNRKTIFYKVYNFCKTSNMEPHIKFNLDGISVKFNTIYGGGKNPFIITTPNHSHPYINGKTEDGRTYAECAFKKSDCNENKQEQPTVKFNTIAEAKNFIKTVQTDFYMFVNSLTKRDVHVSLIALPWMGDSINPSTGKKGYKSEWTDADFYKFFNITPEEQKIIKETMAKYK